ncbi:MAG: type III polyketide synthase [Bacteroidia bacterium]|nr:type III polyketide synthase [Bacteroidia bacterium]
MAYINAVGTSVPGKKIPQERIFQFMQKAHGLDQLEARKLRVLYRATGISTRHSVIQDYERDNDFEFFPNSENLEPFPSTSDRMKVYQKEAKKLSLEAIRKIKSFNPEEITHLITVSCTGMYAPGLDIDLTNELGIRKDVQRTNIYFMGCQAAFNGLKVANAICEANPSSKVLLVCVELCTLHFQKEITDDSLLANSLFSDGAAAALITGELQDGLNLSIEEFVCALHPEGRKEMAWKIGDFGFEMKLSAYVPDIIRGGIKGLTDKLLNSLKVSFDKVKHFAIHPGGKRILRFVEEELDIPKDKNLSSHKVLRDFGNMSSPTILFVLNDVIEGLIPQKEPEYILNFAFGPGLTLESMLLKTQFIHE